MDNISELHKERRALNAKIRQLSSGDMMASSDSEKAEIYRLEELLNILQHDINNTEALYIQQTYGENALNMWNETLNILQTPRVTNSDVGQRLKFLQTELKSIIEDIENKRNGLS